MTDICEACHKKELPKDNAVVYVSDHPFNVCDECERLLMVILQKFEEREEDYEQSVRLPKLDQ